MAVKADRGTKRTCRSGAGGARFYDLNRDPVVCPMCATLSTIAAPVVATAGPVAATAQRRPAKKPDFPAAEAASELPEGEGEAALADVEGIEKPGAAGEEETFLAVEPDEGGDVSGIVGGGPAEGEEEP